MGIQTLYQMMTLGFLVCTGVSSVLAMNNQCSTLPDGTLLPPGTSDPCNTFIVCQASLARQVQCQQGFVYTDAQTIDPCSALKGCTAGHTGLVSCTIGGAQKMVIADYPTHYLSISLQGGQRISSVNACSAEKSFSADTCLCQ